MSQVRPGEIDPAARRLFSKKQVAAMFGCSVSKIEKMMAADQIGYQKIGTLVRFRPCDLQPFFEGTPSFPPPVPPHKEKTTAVASSTSYVPVRGEP